MGAGYSVVEGNPVVHTGFVEEDSGHRVLAFEGLAGRTDLVEGGIAVRSHPGEVLAGRSHLGKDSLAVDHTLLAIDFADYRIVGHLACFDHWADHIAMEGTGLLQT